MLAVLITSRAMNAEHLLREVELAISGRVPVIPVRLDGTMLAGGLQYLLSSVQWIDCVGEPPEQCAEKLHAALERGELGHGRPARRTPAGGPWLVAAVGMALLAVAAFALRPQGGAVRPALPPAPVPLQADTAGLPVAELLKTVWTNPPPAAGPSRPALALDILAARDGADTLVAIADDDALRSAVDLYVLVARPRTPGHLYVFQIDAKGALFWLFPRNDTCEFSSGDNPVMPGQIVIPGNGLGLSLDDVPGHEYVCAVFANARWPELEGRLTASAKATDRSRPLPAELSASRTRGVAGVRPIPQGQGTMRVGDRDLAVPAFGPLLHEASGSAIVIGRSFLHE